MTDVLSSKHQGGTFHLRWSGDKIGLFLEVALVEDTKPIIRRPYLNNRPKEYISEDSKSSKPASKTQNQNTPFFPAAEPNIYEQFETFGKISQKLR